MLAKSRAKPVQWQALNEVPYEIRSAQAIVLDYRDRSDREPTLKLANKSNHSQWWAVIERRSWSRLFLIDIVGRCIQGTELFNVVARCCCVRSPGGFPLLVLLCAITLLSSARGEPQFATIASLVSAYPEFLDRIDAGDLVWKDGTRMHIDDGKGPKSLEDLLNDPDLKDMFAMRYPLGEKGIPPSSDFDPGRIRYAPLFTKMYGDCRTATANAAKVMWLRSQYGRSVAFTKINGAAAALQKVSDELDRLPPRLLEYLRPLQGTYNCRPIAETSRPSPHSFGIAIDIAQAHSDYWLWPKPHPGHIAYKNQIPWEIIHAFENHGFIWGGKWYHYDTMHFEYRPEMIMSGQ